MNPLYQMMGGGGLPPVIQQFLQFQQTFRGDPRAQVQQMLNTGRISQADYNRAVQTANSLMNMIPMSGRHR